MTVIQRFPRKQDERNAIYPSLNIITEVETLRFAHPTHYDALQEVFMVILTLGYLTTTPLSFLVFIR
jgi:hypothetical protein